MSSYFLIPLGFVIGLLIVVTVHSIRVQNSPKYTEDFFGALKIYFKRSVGRLILAVLVMLASMFILEDLKYNAFADNDNALKYKSIIANILGWLRTYSVFLGVAAEWLGFWIVNRSKKIFITTEEDKKD